MAALCCLLHHFIHHLHTQIEVPEFRIDRNALNGVGSQPCAGDQPPAQFANHNDVNIVIHAELTVCKELTYRAPLLLPKAHIQRVKKTESLAYITVLPATRMGYGIIASLPVFTPAALYLHLCSVRGSFSGSQRRFQRRSGIHYRVA